MGDLRTGQIHELRAGENIDDLARRLRGKPSDFVELEKPPAKGCKRCHGTGMVPRTFGKHGRRALRRHRFKPCRCTKKAKGAS